MKRTLGVCILAAIAAAVLAQMPKPGGGGATQSASPGALVFLEGKTASSSATLDFSCPVGTYDEYKFTLSNVIPSTDAQDLMMRFSTNGGSTFDSGANYSWLVKIFRVAAEATAGAESGATEVNLTNYDIKNTTTDGGVSGEVHLYGANNSSSYKRIAGHSMFTDGTYQLGGFITSRYASTSAITDVRFFMSSGNITSGSIYCYGVAKQ